MPTDRNMSSHFEGANPLRTPTPPGKSGWPPEGAGRALPPCLPATACFPLSISHHFSPRPSAPVRPAPWQIRVVPLCRLFRRPPAGPSDHPSARAWQIRLISLCRLVWRASNSSCAGLFHACPGRKNAQHNSMQFQPVPAPPLPCGLGYRHSQWHNCRAVTNPPRCVSRRTDERLQSSVYLD